MLAELPRKRPTSRAHSGRPPRPLLLRVVVVLDVVQFYSGRHILYAAQSVGAGDPCVHVWLRVYTQKV